MKVKIISLLTFLILLLPVMAGCIPSQPGYVNIGSMPEGWLSANVSLNGSIILPTPTFDVNLATPTITIPDIPAATVVIPTPTITIPAIPAATVQVTATGATGQGFTWRGAWQSGNNYNAYDICTDLGYCYSCISSFTNSTTHPASDGTHFSVMASKGDAGSAGSAGQGFNWRGAWASGQNYALYDVLTNSGNCYDCILAINNSTTVPGSDGTHFALLAQGSGGYVKVKTETRSMNGASGDVSYTGYGFAPSSLKIFANVDYTAYGCMGMCDANKTMVSFYYYYSASSSFGGGILIFLRSESATVGQSAVIKSYDSDGFTLTWTKVSTPTTGTATIIVEAIK